MVTTTEVFDALGEDGVERGERGTALPDGYYILDGTVFDYRTPSIRDIETMFDTDAQAQALENAITQPIRSVKANIESTKGDRGEAEFCREVLMQPHYRGGMTTIMETLVAQMAGGIFRRRAHFEKVWKVRPDGRVVYHKVAFRPASSCRVLADDNGSFFGFKQEGVRANGRPLEEYFLPNKAFVYIYNEARNPLKGNSLAQTAYRSYIDKQKVLRLYFVHLQNVALSSIKGEYDGPQGEKGQGALLKKIRDLRGGGAIVLGPGESASFFEGGRAGGEFKEALQYLDAQMAGSMLVRFLQLGTDSKSGSWSLSRDHSDFFLMSLESILREMAVAITQYLLAPLVYHNFGADAAFPVFVFERLSDTARVRALSTWEKIITAATPPDIDEEVMQEIIKKALPAIDIDLGEIERNGGRPTDNMLRATDRIAGLMEKLRGGNGSINSEDNALVTTS